jgi:hypothetical protein
VGLQQGAVVMPQWQQPCVEGDVEAVRPYTVGEEVSWTGGESMRPHCTLGRASAPWLCGYARAGRAMLGARWRAFTHVSSASGAGGARLRRQPPGAGISGGAAMGGNRAVASGNGTPRCTAADPMAQGGRCTRGHPQDGGVVMGGRPVAGNLAGVATRASRGGGFGGRED